MMKLSLHIIYVPLILFTISSSIAQSTQITYKPSLKDFPNPERGFYRYSETRSGNYQVLDANTLAGYRDLHQPLDDPNFKIHSSLVFRYFFLEDFKNSPISQSFLDNMELDFQAARDAGVKIIVRFAYTDEVDGSGCSNWICPPYGDAPKEWVLFHIDQLAPVLASNQDVVAVIQMGFIGVWGENYYTDFFGDASQPPGFKLFNNNWQDRNEVLQKMLDVFPKKRMIQVRYPQIKQRLLGGINAPTNYPPLDLEEAFSGSDASRIGFHNDCFLASPTDFGTYNDYGNDSLPSLEDTTNLKPYLAADSKFVAVGGETCSPYNPYDNCSGSHPSARADSELRRFHYSYLNAQYNHPDVNADWIGDCMEMIKKQLGYSFKLKNGSFPNTASTGQSISFSLDIENEGYATPFNPRKAVLVMRNTITGESWFAPLNTDPRFWLEQVSLQEEICLPSEMPEGSYELLMHLPDPEADLYFRPEYAIRFANLLPNNQNIWEEVTGFNKLGHTIEVINGEATNCTEISKFTQCPPELFISRVEQTVYSAYSSIESTASIENGDAVTFEAGKSITLKPPFHAKSGSLFSGIIEENCSASSYSNIVINDRSNQIEDFKNKNTSLSIYPNPTTGKVTLEGDIQGPIRIFDILGKEVSYKKHLNFQDPQIKTLDLEELHEGWYVILVGSERYKILKIKDK